MLSRILSIFTFSNATLLVALMLSTIAAWYSIIGLIAIFAGAVIPIIIMGSALELAKITATVWLRKYWGRAGFMLKLYLVPAVIALALLTSMGIFGFLSKAHMDQGMISGDVQAKIAIYDEKIKTSQDNIDVNRKALKQLDEAVDQVMGRSTSETGADKAVAVRKSQAKERTRLLAEIAAEQKTITGLREERAPIAAEVRKVEAEVGPIKYIAALIYGDNSDTNTLEAAVRWVIILLVIVFDPLAIALVLAANASKKWDEEGDSPLGTETPTTPTVTEPAYEPDDGPLTEEQIVQIKESVNEPINCYMCGTVLENARGIGLFCPNKKCDVMDGPFLDKEPIKINVILPTSNNVITPEEEEAFAEIEKRLEKPKIEPIIDTSPNFEGVRFADGEWVQTGPAFKSTQSEPKKELYKDLGDDYVEFEGKRMGKHVLQQMRPDLFALKEDNPREIEIGFGSTLPSSGLLGDNFIKTDILPHEVFKYNGKKWIPVDKLATGVYLGNVKYLHYLMEKISTGEYDPDLLSDYEQDAIANHIKSSE